MINFNGESDCNDEGWIISTMPCLLTRNSQRSRKVNVLEFLHEKDESIGTFGWDLRYLNL